MIEEQLIQYGVAGIFIAYLIIRDNTLMRQMTTMLGQLKDNVKQNTEAIKELKNLIFEELKK